MWQAMAAGAGAGALKYGFDQAAAERDRDLQAEIARYSPWTGMQAHAVKDPSLIGNIAQGTAAGAQIGQGMGGGGPESMAMGQTASAPGTSYSLSDGGASGSQFNLGGTESLGSAGSLNQPSQFSSFGSPWQSMQPGQNSMFANNGYPVMGRK